MISFVNEGLIDIEAITTMGVSVKDKEDAIGYFGTGLKYAIAIILRNGGRITMYRGMEKFKFTTREHDVRGENFSIVYMNDERLGFTDQLGKNWEPWMAYRELCCNAFDESGYVERDFVPPEEGKTTIVVNCKHIEDAAADHDSIFIPTKPFEIVKGVQFHETKHVGRFMYYRGVRVASFRHPSLFNYNVVGQMKLTEDRTVHDIYNTEFRITDAIVTSKEKEFLYKVITAERGILENALDFNHFLIDRPGPAFMKMVEETPRGRILNDSIIECYKRFNQKEKSIVPIVLSSVEEQQMNKAKAFLVYIGYDVGDTRIIVSADLPNDVLGMAKNGTIYLSRAVFQQGTKQVAVTLLEEFFHIKHGYKDKTYEFQNFLFNVIGSVGELALGEPL